MALDAAVLADLIDKRLDALLVADGLPALPTAPPEQVRDRERLFLAIARAVVDHLHANPDAFKLKATVATGGVTVTMTGIEKV